jgi:hypothetical protein
MKAAAAPDVTSRFGADKVHLKNEHPDSTTLSKPWPKIAPPAPLGRDRSTKLTLRKMQHQIVVGTSKRAFKQLSSTVRHEGVGVRCGDLDLDAVGQSEAEHKPGSFSASFKVAVVPIMLSVPINM